MCENCKAITSKLDILAPSRYVWSQAPKMANDKKPCNRGNKICWI